MNKENNNIYGNILYSWIISEHEKHYRESSWFIIAGAISFILLIYSIYTSNFLFALIIMITAFVIILNEGKEPLKLKFFITEDGIIVGRKFYDYDEIKDFSIIYKPREDIKRLYFEFKNSFRPRLSIPLLKNNPLPIRDTLLKYLKEDLERTSEPLSEAISKLFKL